jgi:hypothetical protein
MVLAEPPLAGSTTAFFSSLLEASVTLNVMWALVLPAKT